MDLVLILMDPVHGPGPRRGSMDQGSMFCTFPFLSPQLHIEIKLNFVMLAQTTQVRYVLKTRMVFALIYSGVLFLQVCCPLSRT